MYLVPTFNPHRPVSPAEVQERGTNSLFVASSAPLRKKKSKSSALQMAAVRADFIHDNGHKIMVVCIHHYTYSATELKSTMKKSKI